MKIIKRYLLIIISVLIITSMVLSGVYLKNQVKNYKVGISDLQGDRANLQGIKISGTVADILHKQEFTIDSGNIKTDLSALTKEERENLYTSTNDNLNQCEIRLEAFNDAETSAASAQMDEEVRCNKADAYFRIMKKNSSIEPIFQFKADYSFYSDNNGIVIQYHDGRSGGYGFDGIDSGLRYYPNAYSVRINKENGRTYVFTRTGSGCTGFGGAYDITEQINTYNNIDNTDLKNDFFEPIRIEVKNIAPIDLKDGNIRIIEMETAGNYLVFTTIENNEVILKTFDLNQNIFLEDINLGYQKFADNSDTGIINYFGQTDGKYIYMFFPNEQNEKTASSSIVYNTELQKVVFINNETAAETEKSDYQNSSVNLKNLIMKYRDDKLYILKKYTRSYYGYKYTNGTLNDYELRISVLSESGTLYEGIIDSYISDDRHFSENNQLQTALQYREYFNLALE